jgi:tRNA pseudouridine55 synthase
MILVVDKPVGPSSAQVVAIIKRAFRRQARATGRREPRVGHGGTLDPMASGVLPVLVGEATKVAPFLLSARKTYEATIQFGANTDTQDAEGNTVESFSTEGLSVELISDTIATFLGVQTQIPPMFSALKVEGTPLYELARAGEEIERAPRTIEIFAFDLLGYDASRMAARVRVECSKGTYIRTLGFDLGRKLGTGAHLTALRRTQSGPFSIAEALTLEQIEADLAAGRMPPHRDLLRALDAIPHVEIDAVTELRVRRGQPVAWADLSVSPGVQGPVALVSEQKDLVAIVERADSMVDDAKIKILRGFSAQETTAQSDDSSG